MFPTWLDKERIVSRCAVFLANKDHPSRRERTLEVIAQLHDATAPRQGDAEPGTEFLERWLLHFSPETLAQMVYEIDGAYPDDPATAVAMQLPVMDHLDTYRDQDEKQAFNAYHPVERPVPDGIRPKCEHGVPLDHECELCKEQRDLDTAGSWARSDR